MPKLTPFLWFDNQAEEAAAILRSLSASLAAPDLS